MPDPGEIGLDRIIASHDAVSDLYARTPSLRIPAIDDDLGGPVRLKAESLQPSGSFKLRGVSSKLNALGGEAANGVVAGTAGNHGRALAYAAQRQGIPCELFVPLDAPISKTEPAADLGAVLTRCEGTVDDCVARARERADEGGLAFCHPFDDPDVIAGQGSVGLELLDQVPELDRVVVPLGGGGLACGIAIAIRSQRPEVEVIGVQVESCPSYPESLERGEAVTVKPRSTVADGIAVKRPGELTMPLVEEWLAEVVVVSEDEVGDAMALLLADAKLVVEGAGAVGVAALAAGKIDPSEGTTAVILSGGNVDESVLAAIARRSGARSGRGAVLFTTISDRPGSLAALLEAVGTTGASVVDVQHVRDAVDLHVAETGVELILETRGRDHTRDVIESLRAREYDVQLQHRRFLDE